MTTGTDPSRAISREPCHAILLESGADPVHATGLGGKGHSLAALIANGFPVPATGVITTSAYRDFTSDSDLAEFIEGLTSGGDATKDAVDDTFASTPIPAHLELNILDMVRRVGDGGLVAVRSSATVEDLEGSSFAGQYRSLLAIDSTDSEQVLAAVKQVWASLWHPAPTAYRRAFGIDESNVAMAVVVMAMVPATSAGVVFTIDPGGTAGAARIESVQGLGEALVSGAETPDAWVVPRAGSRELPDVQRRALGLALAIEEMTDVPQDVEWAASGEGVVVVQARPITVLATDDGFDTPIDDHELTTAGIIEMVPGVLSPLRWDLNSFLLEEAFRSVLDSLGILRGSEAESRPFVRRVRGRAAMDFDQLRSAAASVPGAVQELEMQYFGSPSEDTADDEARRGPASIMRDLRTIRTRRNVIEAAEILIHTVEGLRERSLPLTTMSDEELLAQARRLVDLAARGLAAELGVAASGAAAYRRLELLLARHLGAQAAGPAVQSVITTSSARTRRSPSASAAVFAGETWIELGMEPTEPPAHDEDGRRERLEALEERLTSLPGWRRRRILTGQFVDVRIHLIRRTVNEMVEQIERRERAKAAILELGGDVRRVHHELGRRLFERGALPSPGDVEHLTTSEISRLCANVQSAPGPDVLRRRRNWLSRYEAEGQLPLRFIGVPSREPAPLPSGDILFGWAASPGRHRGRARVVKTSSGALADGEILVAEATDASWSPLFVRAGAVVVERGGPLSHAAILARELGLPAVLNVDGATAVLDGRTVSVDGDQGVVVLEVDAEDVPT